MTANIYKDLQAVDSIMSIEYKNIASTVIIPMMQRSGIRRLEVKKIAVGSAIRTIPEATHFGELPEKLKLFAIMAKYPIAEIMALTGVAVVDIEASEEEVASLMATYAKLNEASENAKSEEVAQNEVEITENSVGKAVESVEGESAAKCSDHKACSPGRRPRKQPK